MAITDILNENRLATTSTVLGFLSIAAFFLMQGTVNVFLYLGIPAVVLGVISLMEYREQHHHIHLASLVLPVAGILLGLLPILFTVLGIF
jgi:uncharacterized membrane protein